MTQKELYTMAEAWADKHAVAKSTPVDFSDALKRDVHNLGRDAYRQGIIDFCQKMKQARLDEVVDEILDTAKGI